MPFIANPVSYDLRVLRGLSKGARAIPGGRRLGELLLKHYADQDRDVLLEDFDGSAKFQVNLSDHIGGQIFWHGQYSFAVLQLAAKLLGPTDTVFDVGANIGEFSVFAARRLPFGQLHAFEPMRELCARARRNCELNELHNAHVHQLGLGAQVGNLPIYKVSTPDDDGAVNNGMNTLFNGEGFKVAENIDIVTLDEWCERRQVSKLELMKIDVEGAELSMLLGGSATIKRLRPKMIIEVNKTTCLRAGYAPRDLLDYIVGLGYSISNIGSSGKLSAFSDYASVSRDILCLPR